MEPEQALELAWGRPFKKDKRKLERQSKNLDKLWEIVALLQSRQPLPERCRVISDIVPSRLTTVIPPGFQKKT